MRSEHPRMSSASYTRSLLVRSAGMVSPRAEYLAGYGYGIAWDGICESVGYGFCTPKWSDSMDCPFSPLPEAHIAHLRSKVGAFLPAYPCLSLPIPARPFLPGATSATERCAGIALGSEKCGIAREKIGQLWPTRTAGGGKPYTFSDQGKGRVENAMSCKQDKTRWNKSQKQHVFEDVFRATLVYKTLFLLRGTPHHER